MVSHLEILRWEVVVNKIPRKEEVAEMENVRSLGMMERADVAVDVAVGTGT
jgi:hypothetical protein